MAPDGITWVKARIGDELGLTEEALARLYGVDERGLDRRLAALGRDPGAVYQRVLTDVDSLRQSQRLIQLGEEHVAAVRALLGNYIFHPLVSVRTADEQIGWRLSSDDAQYVAFRTADTLSMDFEWGDVLRLRLNRLVIWPAEVPPAMDSAFRNRLTEVTVFLVELTGVL
jgi:hypothetical protein